MAFFKNAMRIKVTPFFVHKNTATLQVFIWTPDELKNGAREARDQEKTLKNMFFGRKKDQKLKMEPKKSETKQGRKIKVTPFFVHKNTMKNKVTNDQKKKKYFYERKK